MVTYKLCQRVDQALLRHDGAHGELLADEVLHDLHLRQDVPPNQALDWVA